MFLLLSVKKKKSFLLNYVLLKKVWEDHVQIINTSGKVYIQYIDSAVSPQSTHSLAPPPLLHTSSPNHLHTGEYSGFGPKSEL